MLGKIEKKMNDFKNEIDQKKSPLLEMAMKKTK